MRLTLRLFKRFVLVLLPILGLTACDEPRPTKITWRFELKAGVGEITLHDLRGEASLFERLVTAWVEGDQPPQALLPRVTLGERALVVDGAALNLVLPIQFDERADLPLLTWDKKHPARFCPPMGQVITRANAKARDPDGCVVWGRRASTLLVETAPMDPETAPSLLPVYMTWVQAGSPPFEDDETETETETAQP
ncbi:hypothetical protein L6R46_05150 [Myxococcota bacterium]|jgi:hypothetical protein|nr:hypothetical protein [Myxococcota bacterium]